jgi:uncharacterized membrane protein
MPWNRAPQPKSSWNSAPETKERIVCGFSYLSLGMIGLAYYLFKGGKGESSWFRFHFYQSILAGLFVILFGWAVSALMQVLGGLATMVPGGSTPLMWLSKGLSLICQALYLVLLYGAVMAFLGKLADIPGIAKIARSQMR